MPSSVPTAFVTGTSIVSMQPPAPAASYGPRAPYRGAIAVDADGRAKAYGSTPVTAKS